MMIIFLIAGVIGFVYLMNYLRGKPGLNIDGLNERIAEENPNSPLEILQKRFASGEISQSEYNDIKKTLIDESDY